MSDLNDPRVLFAAERTLLAWNRTSLGLIAFGFVVERAGLLLKVVAPSHSSPGGDILTFWLGLAVHGPGCVCRGLFRSPVPVYAQDAEAD